MINDRLTILSDFDNTVVHENVAQLLAEQFSSFDVEKCRQRYREKEITFKDYQEIIFSGVSASQDTLKEYTQTHANIRDGFIELVNYCQGKNILFNIVTLGLDFYVNAILEQYELKNVPAFAVATKFTSNGIEYSYPTGSPECAAWGNCKCVILARCRNSGSKIAYIGDGVSDACPAFKADYIFALGALAKECEKRNKPYYPIVTFFDVMGHLDEMGW
tara:strand:- start:1730 stop:2383 length:654 start_codon:yes stop_codon:yes gene_type:complete